MWDIKYTNEFEQWWQQLSEKEQGSLLTSIEILRHTGPALSRPHVDTLKGSKHPNMKELRTQHQGRPLRTFFAFDPKRAAILLIGGDKTGDKQFYKKMIPLADKIYTNHLKQISEGE